MTRTAPVKKFFLILAGLFLGLLIYSIYFVGGFFTLAGFLVERATQPVSMLEQPRAGVNMREEVLKVLGDVRLGGLTSIDQKSVNDLLSTGFQGLPASGGYTLGAVAVDFEPATIQMQADLRLDGASVPAGKVALRPVATRLRTRIHAVPGEAGLLLSLQEVRLNRLPIPLFLIKGYAAKFDISATGLPVEPVESLTVSLPYIYLGGLLPEGLELSGLEVRQGMLAARLRVDSGLEQDFMHEISPFLQQYGTALRDAVAAAFPMPGAEEEKLLRLTEELVRIGRPGELIPQEATALVSFLENQVWAEPPAQSPFIPEVGSDLFTGTVVRTAKNSSLEMILRDGSLLKVGENSRFRLETMPDSTDFPRGRFTLQDGIVRGRIAKAAGTDYVFQTPSALLDVRGTDLVVRADGGRELSVSVIEGRVAVIPAERAESLVGQSEKLEASGRKLGRKVEAALPTEGLSESDRSEIEVRIPILSSPESANSIRETRRFWNTADSLTKTVSLIMRMDGEKRERLGEELEKRIPPAEVDRMFSNLMENPSFATAVRSLSIEGIPYP